MSLIVDASVAVRWYVPEEGSEDAERILAADLDLFAPELVIAEIGSAVWKRVRKGEVTIELAVSIVERATKAFSDLTPLTNLAPQAMRLAAQHNHSIYDCFYIALALQTGASLATADQKQGVVAGRSGVTVELLR